MRHHVGPLLSLAAVCAAGAAVAQQQPPAPTPVPQTVVAPSLPDQKNKEGTVSPGGALKTDAGGWADTGMGAIDPNAKKTTDAAGATKPGSAPPPGAGGAGTTAMPTPVPGPKGKTVVGAAYLSVRGVVKAYEKGVSITVTEANGKDRTVPLAAKAVVYEGLAVGDKVVLRIPLAKPADGKSADLVEKPKPKKAPPKSKFAQAQSPAS